MTLDHSTAAAAGSAHSTVPPAGAAVTEVRAGMAYYPPVAEDGPGGVATGADRCAEPLMGTCGLIADS